MSESDPQLEAEDPWLTVNEIASELRVNPATVRLWISKGTLPAKRAGRRKLLILRSDLDRMLGAKEPSAQSPEPRMPQPLRPVFSRPPLGEVARARSEIDPSVISDAIRDMQEAEAVFGQAVEASDNAPPDPGFADRIRAIAQASLQRAGALEKASMIPGFRWTPIQDPTAPIRSHELRPGGNRPGPPAAWRQHDMAVERLIIAVQGNVLSLVASEFREIGNTLNQIADALTADSVKTDR